LAVAHERFLDRRLEIVDALEIDADGNAVRTKGVGRVELGSAAAIVELEVHGQAAIVAVARFLVAGIGAGQDEIAALDAFGRRCRTGDQQGQDHPENGRLHVLTPCCETRTLANSPARRAGRKAGPVGETTGPAGTPILHAVTSRTWRDPR